jgi:putative oxidoreductase
MFPLLSIFSDWSLLVLRLVMGVIVVVHGWPKIKNLKTNAGNFSAMGFKPGMLWGTIAALLEFFGGLALILGFYVQLVAVLFVVEFVAIVIWKIKRGQPFVGGLEFDLALLAVALSLVTLGGGAFSADYYLFLGGL